MLVALQVQPLGSGVTSYGGQLEPYGFQAGDSWCLPVDGRLDVRQDRGTVQSVGRHINLNGLAPVFRGSDAVRDGVLSRSQLLSQRCGGSSRACIRWPAWRKRMSCTALEPGWRSRRQRSSRAGQPPRYAASYSPGPTLPSRCWCRPAPEWSVVAVWLLVGPHCGPTNGFRGRGCVSPRPGGRRWTSS